MRWVSWMLATVVCAAQAAFAAPPVATLERSHWPERIDSPVLFDVASRAHILLFARSLLASESQDEAQLTARLGLRQINLLAVNELRRRLWQRLWRNFDQAQQSCEQDASFCYAIDSESDLRAQAADLGIDPESFYSGFAVPGQVFSEAYLNELLRRAAVSPQTTSEVQLLSEQEFDGDGFPDRVFLLTFDNGPSPVHGTTDALTDYLRAQSLSATFFVPGQSLQARADKTSVAQLQALYAGQCVAALGWQYVSHAQWDKWQDSVLRSMALLQTDLPDSYVAWFRPPYGQRRSDSGSFFAGAGLKVALWNIDSMDDDSRLTALQAGERVVSLMLLWRRGIVVFHDNLAKAQTAVPWVLTEMAQTGVAWQTCADIE